MSPNRVRLAASSWGADVAGGRIETFGLPGPPMPCAVEPDSGEMVSDHDRQQGVVHYTVKFFGADPLLKIRDRLYWIDGGGVILTVIEPARQAAGRGHTWLVKCEHRPVTGRSD